jgi:hypothetical protein
MFSGKILQILIALRNLKLKFIRCMRFKFGEGIKKSWYLLIMLPSPSCSALAAKTIDMKQKAGAKNIKLNCIRSLTRPQAAEDRKQIRVKKVRHTKIMAAK